MATTSKGTKGLKGLKGVKHRTNKNVSVSPMTRHDKLFVMSLKVDTSLQSKHGNSKSVCWNYYGTLMYDPGNGNKPYALDDRLYCSLCLTDIQNPKGLTDTTAQSTAQCHISKISNFSAQTSSGNLNAHLSTKHSIQTMPEERVNKIVDYLKSYKNTGARPSLSSLPPSPHEFNRDLVVWLCRDLLPFSTVSKDGFLNFCSKYLPNVRLPCESTLSSTALNDVYVAACSEIKKLLSDVNAVCVMLDGWTDRYKARSYNAIRVSFIKDWQFHVVTLNCEVLLQHTGDRLANEVNRILGKFVCDENGLPKKRLFITTCHDGAANVVRASRVLRSEHFQHCMGHCLHLLLSVDALKSVRQIIDLLDKCRDIVTTLHFKGSIIDDEKASIADKAMIDRLSGVIQILELDEQFPLDASDPTDAPDAVPSSSTTRAEVAQPVVMITAPPAHVTRLTGHQTLKQFVCTRWNSNCTMIESILELKSQVHNALLKTGHADLTLLESELTLLEELHSFLKPFLDLTELVSSAGAVLSLQPMMKVRIKKLCEVKPDDDLCIQELKESVLRNVDKRLPVSDTVRVYQILDPETRTFVTEADACNLLKAAIARVEKRGCWSTDSTPTVDPDSLASGQSNSPESKRRRVKQELIRQMR